MIENAHEPWVKVENNKRSIDRTKKDLPPQKQLHPSKNQHSRLLSYTKPKLPQNIPPIPEETENENETTEQQTNSSSKSSSDAKQSALIPNMMVPMNNGTHRVTIHMKKTTIDTKDMENTTAEIYYNMILEFLSAIFTEEGGHIYRWLYDELLDPKVIEYSMSVSQFCSICQPSQFSHLSP